jgi:hypothetical protein
MKFHYQQKRIGRFSVDPHFIPNIIPWEQRFALHPMAIFRVSGAKAAVVTDHIIRFTNNRLS